MDILSIVDRLALVNAARQGKASAGRVELAIRDRQVCISVSDNGHGFSFKGSYDQATLTAGGGSRHDQEPNRFLGGALNIFSAESGARLEITLPLTQPRD